jgi:hypothetical protein
MLRRAPARSSALACALALPASTERRTAPQMSGSQLAARPSVSVVPSLTAPVLLVCARAAPAFRPTVGKKLARAAAVMACASRYWASATRMFWLAALACAMSALRVLSP